MPQKHHSLIALIAGSMLSAGPVYALDVDSEQRQRPRVGLVLSGGGALGLAHIGVLEVLEEMRVPVDCIAGTSMGAMVGGSYAAGVGLRRMREYIGSTDIPTLFDDEPPRSEIPLRLKRDDYEPYFDFTLGFNGGEIQLPAGASAGYRFELFLNDVIGPWAMLPDIDFDELPTPFRAVATDLETGDLAVFGSGNLARALRASMSLPAVVAPAEIDGRIYVDGGLVSNMPVETARELCGDVIIAVDLGTAPQTRDEIRNTLDVALQSILLLTDSNIRRSREELRASDAHIVPDLEDFTSSSFSEQDRIIERGREAARRSSEALQHFSVTEQEYENWQRTRAGKLLQPLRPAAIDVLTSDRIHEEAVLRELELNAGDLDTRSLNHQLVELYGRGDYEYIGYQYNEESNHIVVDARPKSWGPSYLKFGMGAETDFENPTQLNIIVSNRMTWVNSLGAEWRNDLQLGYNTMLRSEFLQPLQLRDGLFVSVFLEARRDFIEIYDSDVRLGDIKALTSRAGASVGLTGVSGEISLSTYASVAKAVPQLGILSFGLTDERLNQPGVRLQAVFDRLDSYAYPRSGMLASVDVDHVVEDWGADQPFTRVEAILGGAISFGEHTIGFKLQWGDKVDDDGNLPPYAFFQLGGPKSLAGLYMDQLTGSHYDLAGLSYYRRFASLPAVLGRGMYIGASLESGEIEDPFSQKEVGRINSASIFWGAETVLGIAYLGLGRADNGQSALYMSIGPRF